MGDSTEYTQYTIFNIKMKITLKVVIITNLGHKTTRIPRNAVSRLPALFHKIEVNL